MRNSRSPSPRKKRRWSWCEKEQKNATCPSPHPSIRILKRLHNSSPALSHPATSRFSIYVISVDQRLGLAFPDSGDVAISAMGALCVRAPHPAFRMLCCKQRYLHDSTLG